MTDNIHIPRISNTPPPIDDLNTSQYSIKSNMSSSSSSSSSSTSSLNITTDPVVKQDNLFENTDKNMGEAKIETKINDSIENKSNLDANNEPPLPSQEVLQPTIDSNQATNDNQAAKVDCSNENQSEIETKNEINLDNLIINQDSIDDSNKQTSSSENEDTTKEASASIPSFDELSNNNQTTNDDINNELFDDCGSINENIYDSISAANCDNKIEKPIVTDEKLDKIIESYNLDSNKCVVFDTTTTTQENEIKQEKNLDFFDTQNSSAPIDNSNEMTSDWNAFENKTETAFNDGWNAFESTNDNTNTNDDGNWASFAQDTQQPTTTTTTIETTTEPDLFKTNVQNTEFTSTTADDDDDWGDFASTNESTLATPAPAVPNSQQLPTIEETKQTSIISDTQASSSNDDVDLSTVEFDKEFENIFKKCCLFEPDSTDAVLITDESNNLTFLNEEIRDEWKTFLDINNSNCLNFKWRSSKLEELLFSSLNIIRSTGNTDKTVKFSSTFEFSNDDDVLQPVKVNEIQQQQSQSNKENENTMSTTINTDEKTLEAPAAQPVTTATLNFQDFDLDYLEKISTNEPIVSTMSSKNNSTSSKPTQKSMLDDLLADIYPKNREETNKSDQKSSSSASPQSQTKKQEPEPTMNFVARTLNVKLTQEALDLLDRLPDLSFMKSKVLMFPVVPPSDNAN